MEKLTHPLPPKAIEILNNLVELRRDRENDMSYIANCCAVESYRKAKRFFQAKSNCEESYIDSLIDFMISRGYKPPFPKEKGDKDEDNAPEYDFTDLRSYIKYGLELCVETTEVYEKATRDMFSVDLLAYNMLMNSLGSFPYEIKEWTDLYKMFENLKEEDDQREFESILFPAQPESISS